MTRTRAVTWDFGQTLAELDTAMLAARLRERGVDADADRLEAAVFGAWRAYDDAIKSGLSKHPWKILMREILKNGGVLEPAIAHHVDWLWDQQPVKNLWRRPIAGMIDLVKELQRAKVPQAIVSNSEGKAAELLEELGWRDLFDAVIDSGKIGLEKPDAAIFEHAASSLGLTPKETVHIGDSLAADVEGALNVGAKAIWFKPRLERRIEGVMRAEDAQGTRTCVVALGLLE